MKISRRGFLKASAVTAGLAAAGVKSAPVLNALAEDSSAGAIEAKGWWKATSCQGCTQWCTAQVYVIDGRAVKVRGNANSKTSVGQLCPRGHLSLQQVYDPDRVKVPMKRTNPRKGRDEDPGWQPITWDEAADIIADKIIELRENGEPHKYLLLRGRYSGMNHILYGNMTKIIGSPNSISHSSICGEVEKMGSYYTENIWGYRDYDMMNTRYALCWGVDPVSSNRNVPSTIRYLGQAKDQGKIAVVDPRLSAAGAKADEWLPVIPGQDGALATAIAHVILTKGLWYKSFAGDFADGINRFVAGQEVDESSFTEKHTHGLVKWWNVELKDRTLEWAQERCGIPAEQIERVATDFAKAAPNVLVWMGPTMHPKGSYTAMAIHALTGLVGSTDNIGGTLAGAPGNPSTGVPSADIYLDELAQKHLSYEKIDQRGRLEWPNLNQGASGGGVNTNRTADGILAEDPYDIKVAIGYWCNFAFANTGAGRWERALEKLPFFAHITTHYAEMTHYADVVLPVAHHMYERWSFVGNKALRHNHISIQQPVVNRIFDVKNDETEIPWLIAKKLAAKGFSNLYDYFRNEFADPETGKKPDNEEEFGLFAVKLATKNVWDPQVEKNGDTINGWAEFIDRGVWNSNTNEYFKRWDNFGTKTGKFEFYSETLKAALIGHAERHNTTVDNVLKAARYDARGEQAFVPHYEAPRQEGDAARYPFLFVDYKSRLNREGRSQNCPWYYEFKDVDPGDEADDDVIKINPVDAERLGLKNGETVRVSSAKGEPITCTLKVWEGVRPGCAAKAYGQGHWLFGRYAANEFGKKERGGNNNKLLHADWDHMIGATARNGGFCRVNIERV